MDKLQEGKLIRALVEAQRENKKLKQRIAMDKHLRKAMHSMLGRSLTREFISAVEATTYRFMMNKSQQTDAENIREYFEELAKEATET